MGKKFIDKYMEANRALADMGFDTGMQKAADLFVIAAHLEFGFGPARVRRLAEKVHELDKEYSYAWRATEESDWAQKQIDTALQQLYGEAFHPWEIRYPWVQQLGYKRRKS